MLWGVVLSLQTRNLPTIFNESTKIAWIVYNTTVACVIFLPTLLINEASSLVLDFIMLFAES